MYHMLAYLTACVVAAGEPYNIPEKCKPVVDTTYFDVKMCHQGAKELMKDRTKRVICFGEGETWPSKPPAKK